MPKIVGKGKESKGNDISSTERSIEAVKKGKKEGAKDEGIRNSKRTQSSGGGGGSSGREKVGMTSSNRHSECSASGAPVSLHPTLERKKKKKKRRKRRSKSSAGADAATDPSGSQNEGDIVTNIHGSEDAGRKSEEEKSEKRKGCKDCLMEHCTGAVTLYRFVLTIHYSCLSFCYYPIASDRTDDTPVDFSFIFKDDVVVDAKKKKDDNDDGDKEAPIDPENVNNPTEPMRIEEKVRRKKKRRKRTERRNPVGHCSTGGFSSLTSNFINLVCPLARLLATKLTNCHTDMPVHWLKAMIQPKTSQELRMLSSVTLN